MCRATDYIERLRVLGLGGCSTSKLQRISDTPINARSKYKDAHMRVEAMGEHH